MLQILDKINSASNIEYFLNDHFCHNYLKIKQLCKHWLMFLLKLVFNYMYNANTW